MGGLWLHATETGLSSGSVGFLWLHATEAGLSTGSVGCLWPKCSFILPKVTLCLSDYSVVHHTVVTWAKFLISF